MQRRAFVTGIVDVEAEGSLNLVREKWCRYCLCFLIAGLFLFAVSLLAPVTVFGDTTVGGTISVDTTWTASGSPYIVTSNITVQGTDGADGVTTLTIEPGTEVRFNQSCQLQIGNGSGDPGALVAVGTTTNQIVFTSNQATPSAGDWYNIKFYTTSDDASTILDYCVVEYAGAYNQGALYFRQSAPTIRNTVVRHCGGYGAYIYYSSAPVIENSQFTDIGNYGLYYYSGTAGGSVTGCTIDKGIDMRLTSTVTFSGNTINYNNSYPIKTYPDYVSGLLAGCLLNNVNGESYLEVSGGTISHDATWPSVISYVIIGSVTVQGADGPDSITTLTIEPGTEVRFNQSCQLQIGNGSGDPGALVAVGTTTNQIVFTSNQATPSAGDWYNIKFYTTSDDASTILDYCVVEYAGAYNQGALYFRQSAPTIRNTVVRHCGGYGAYIYYSSAPVIENSQFTDIGNYGLYYYSGTAGGSVTGCTIDKGIDMRLTSTVTFSGNTINYNNSYPIKTYPDYVSGLLAGCLLNNVNGESYLEVSGGTISHDATWPSVISYVIIGSVTVQGADGPDSITTLTIEPGTEVRFNQSCQLQVGNGSGDPGALVAVGTTTNQIVFTSNQATPSAGDWYNIKFYTTADDASTILEHCMVEYAGAYNQGALYFRQSAPTIRNTVVRHCGGYGAYIYYSSAPVIENCQFDDIGNYGLYYYNGTVGGSVSGSIIDNGIYLAMTTAVSFSGNTINYNNDYPIIISNADNVGGFLEGCTITNTDEDSFLQINSGTISHDATWPAVIPYVVTGVVTISGTDGGDGVTTLTIASGAEVRFNQGVCLQVGNNSSDHGALIAEGTEENSIVFTSNQETPEPGDWYNIRFYSAVDTSLLDHCIIEYSGYSSGTGGIYVSGSSPHIQNTVVQNCGGHGAYIYNGAPVIENCQFDNLGNYGLYYTGMVGGSVTDSTIDNGIYLAVTPAVSFSGNTINYNNDYPIIIGNADNVGRFLEGCTITNTDEDSFLQINSGTICHDATWPAVIPYVVTGVVTISGTDGGDGVTTLTIASGAEVRFNQGVCLQVGNNSSDHGALIAEGTEENSIVFTSNQETPEPGDWYNIRFYSAVDTSLLDHCIIEYSGYSSGTGGIYVSGSSPHIQNTVVQNCGGYGAYVYNGAPVIENCQFDNLGNYGLYYTGTVGGSVTGSTIDNGIYLLVTPKVTFSGNTVNYNNNYPIKTYSDHVGDLLTGCTLTALDEDSYLEVNGGTISHDATWPAVIPYKIAGSITVQSAVPDTTTTLTLSPGAELRFNQGSYLKVGNSSGASGALVAEGTVNDQILFTSSNISPAPGNWTGVQFYTTSDNDTSILNHCIVEYAGYNSSQGAIYLYNASPTVTNTVVRYSLNSGIYTYGAGCVDAAISWNTFYENKHGVYWTISPPPEMHSNNFFDNTDYGLYYTGAEALNAENNWWGDTAGPNNDGDSVYGNVDYSPWALAPFEYGESNDPGIHYTYDALGRMKKIIRIPLPVTPPDPE